MKRLATTQLRKELQEAGAGPNEVGELIATANRVAQLKVIPSANTYGQQSGWRRLAPFALTAIVFTVFGAGIVMFSQSVMPGSVLYPVQKLSDAAAITVHPSYRSTIMVKRMLQMTALIDHHASEAQVLAAVADYRSAAAGYHGGSSNYETLEFCRGSLQQASAQTTGKVRDAIIQALGNLQRA